MSPNRFPNIREVPPTLLANHLKFPNGREAQNRFLKAALTEIQSSYDREDDKKHGVPTQAVLNIYDKWGHGKFGMILSSNIMVHPTHLEAAGNMIIFEEGDCPSRREVFSRMAANMKNDGALAVLQLSHAGRQTPLHLNPSPWSASDVHLQVSPRGEPFGKPTPFPLELIQKEIIDRFLFAARFAYDCGFDGVQLHGAHGYLLSQFTSPTTNKRTDKYGGSLENRNRIIIEIYEAIRKEIPAHTGFLVGIKTNSVEFQAEGTSLEDVKMMCKVYEEEGFDFVELSGGNYEQLAWYHAKESTKKREAFFIEVAEEISPLLKNTVLYVTGGFRTVPAMLEAIRHCLTQGIGLGRPVTAEPDLPKKILEGKVMSAIKDVFENEQVALSVLASGSQLLQMGRTSWEEAGGNAMHQISDFSDPKVATRFGAALMEFIQQAGKDMSEGKIPKANVEFD